MSRRKVILILVTALFLVFIARQFSCLRRETATVYAVDDVNRYVVFETEDGNLWGAKCPEVNAESEYVLTFHNNGTEDVLDDKVIGFVERR